MKKHIILITAILVLLLAGCAKRNSPWQNEDMLTLKRHIEVVGNPLDISFDTENIYVALDQGGISIITVQIIVRNGIPYFPVQMSQLFLYLRFAR